jgi:hypothetical protein
MKKTTSASNRKSAPRGRAKPRRAATSNPGVEPGAAVVPEAPAVVPAAAARQRPTQSPSYAKRHRSPNKENAMQCNKTRTGLSLLSGAGLGAVLMYIFDPDQGQQRRAEAAETAARAAESTGAALGAAYEVAREKGQTLGHRLGEYGTAGAEAASAYSARMAERAGETGRSLGKSSRYYTQQARENIGSPRSWLGQEEKRSYVPSTGSTVSAVACLAAGFGLMYLMDPEQGRRRRAIARDKTFKWLREVGDMSRKTGRHLANKSKGYAHETMSTARGMAGGVLGAEGYGRSIADRIRSRISTLGRGRNVNVDCDDCGRVTLAGDCTPEEITILVTEVQAIPGVDSIDNRINVGANAGLGQ